MPAISRAGRGHGPLLQKIAELQSEQIYDNHYNIKTMGILFAFIAINLNWSIGGTISSS
jgi:hypothetical protein